MGSKASATEQLRSPVSYSADLRLGQYANGYNPTFTDASQIADLNSFPTAALSPMVRISTPRRTTKSASTTSGVRGKLSAPKASSWNERKKVSRACDLCKAKKARCSGTQPCNRCISQRLECEYKAEHRRGNPASPAAGLRRSPSQRLPVLDSNSKQSFDQADDNQPSLPVEASTMHHPSIETQSLAGIAAESEETLFEGHYVGPTSGIAFLYRAQRRFRLDSAITKSRDNISNSVKSSIFNFGDSVASSLSSMEFVLPDEQDARSLLDRYFEFAVPTYRFLHRPTVEIWLESLYSEGSNGTMDKQTLSAGKTAVVLMTLATASLYKLDETGALLDGETSDHDRSCQFFAAAERRLAQEVGPARLESVQARLSQCLYLMGSSRINQAWYIFGTTCQLILALGLHRKGYAHSSVIPSERVEIECRKRIFWSAYTLDRYLSVILGRPRTFRDEDIDQTMPERVNDTDLTDIVANSRSSWAQCIHDAPVFHARLARIIGSISNDLYPTNKPTHISWLESTKRHTAEILAWKESLPAFLDPNKVDPSMLIPVFQRQSIVLSLAYAHALILANRPSLLNNFADLSRRQNSPSDELEGSLIVCLDAACLVVDTVNSLMRQKKLYRTFWFAQYISFCAIAVLYVYAIQQSVSFGNHDQEREENISNASPQQHNFHFEAAEKCQRNIAELTARGSPFKRYNIILHELKRDVLYHLRKSSTNHTPMSRSARKYHSTSQVSPPEYSSHPTDNIRSKTTNGGTVPNETPDKGLSFGDRDDLFAAPDLTLENFTMDSNLSDAMDSSIFSESLNDLNFIGPQGELVGWSEFDSWAMCASDGIHNL